jgi:hypothetical protein
VFPHLGLKSGLAKNSDQFENMVQSPVPKPLISVILHNIVLANQLIRSICNVRHKPSLRLPFPDTGGDLRQWHHQLRQGGLFSFHLETKLLVKRPQAASKKLFHHIATTNQRGCLNESHKVSIFQTTRRRNLHEIVQLSHS